MTISSGTSGRGRQVAPSGGSTHPFRHMSGQVRNTVKDLVSVLKGHFQGAETPDNLALIQKNPEAKNAPEYWKDWRWQVRHAVRNIDTFQQRLGIQFSQEERADLQKTIEKFPLSITPYYLSLIEVNDYKNDPIFKQAFPSQKELIVENYELSDPLAEDKDSPCFQKAAQLHYNPCHNPVDLLHGQSIEVDKMRRDFFDNAIQFPDGFFTHDIFNTIEDCLLVN
jgi:hypothetical protein